MTLILLFASQILNSIHNIHNWNRLQKTFVLAAGLPLYHGKDSGPALNTLYGPVSVIAYLPATFFPTPASAMRAACFLALTFYLLPVGWIFWGRKFSHAVDRRWAWLLFFGFCFLTLMMYSLKNAAFNVHVDAPTLGLGMVSCAFLYFRKKPDCWISLFLSAATAVLAVESKLVAAPLVAALPIYILLTDGRKIFFRYCGFLLFHGIFWTLLFGSVFGAQNLFFNTVVIPAHHPFKENGGIQALFLFCDKLIREYLLILPVFFIAVWHREKWRRAPGILLLVVAALMLPAAYLGFVKIGGSRNALSYTNYFLLTGLMMAWLGSVCQENAAMPARPFGLKKITVLLMLFLTAAQAAYAVSGILRPAGKINQANVAYEYAKAHPQETYFPTLTPIHWFAEGQFYHDVNAVMDRNIAGYPLTEERLAAFFPARLRLIAFPEGNDYMGWLHPPQFGPAGRDSALPGFIVYQKQ